MPAKLIRMIGTALIEELVKTVILSGKVKNLDISPVSLLLISPPEQGKTSIVMEQKCKSVEMFTDITGTGILKVCEQFRECTHIVLLDLLAATSHKSSVNKYLMSIIASASEEGVRMTATPEGVKQWSPGDGKKGFICCLTPSMAKDGRNMWNKVGFTSRMLPFNFYHSDSLRTAIKGAINQGPTRKEIRIRDFVVPEARIPVRIDNTNLINEISYEAERKSRELEETGYRRLKQFRSLACGHALLRSWKNPCVTKEDIEFLKTVMPYVSYSKGVSI